MRWLDSENLDKTFIPQEFNLELLEKVALEQLVEDLKIWYPALEHSFEKRHLNTQFYLNNFFLKGGNPELQFAAYVLKKENEIALFVVFQKCAREKFISSPVGAINPKFRGAKLAYVGPKLLESLGRAMGCFRVQYLATLELIHQQKVAEACGYVGCGIVPASDTDSSADGGQLLYEILYIKTLCDPGKLKKPDDANLTEKTKALFATCRFS